MSASTEKKNRSSARLDGTDKRTVAKRKAAEKESRQKSRRKPSEVKKEEGGE